MPPVPRSTAPGQMLWPFRSGEAVTPSDTVNLSEESRGLYVGGVGDVTVVWKDDTTSLLSAVPAGSLLPVRVKRVNATATSATLIVALR